VGAKTLATVMFTDIVGSTEMAASLGDHEWQQVLRQHETAVKAALQTHGGKSENFTGDGYMSSFKSPRDAVSCATEIVGSIRTIGLELRVGIHTGEVERNGRSIQGLTVHTAARIAARAEANEILVSGPVRDLIGDESKFLARGTHTLKGVPGRKALYAVRDANDNGSTTTRNVVSVLVVDDHPLWRETLHSLLENSGLASVVAEAGDGETAVALYAEQQPDVVLMDLDMPRMNGIDAAAAITGAFPAARIVILSSLNERPEVVAAVRAGVSGFLVKTASADDIVAAIVSVKRGEVVFPAELSSLILAEVREPSTPAGLDTLSARENDVLALMAEGLSNEAIGKQLHLATKTIEAHVASIFTKLDIGNAPDANRRVKAVVAFLTSRQSHT
jgi:DNA-binding NarL/FixJ family response regulator/class 3 adenylate cyclase